jgi:hypothetical protein
VNQCHLKDADSGKTIAKEVRLKCTLVKRTGGSKGNAEMLHLLDIDCLQRRAGDGVIASGHVHDAPMVFAAGSAMNEDVHFDPILTGRKVTR